MQALNLNSDPVISYPDTHTCAPSILTWYQKDEVQEFPGYTYERYESELTHFEFELFGPQRLQQNPTFPR